MSGHNMETKELILREIEMVPEPYLGELLDYIHFLKAKASRNLCETAIASESSLKKDWLMPEEDEAWKNL